MVFSAVESKKDSALADAAQARAIDRVRIVEIATTSDQDGLEKCRAPYHNGYRVHFKMRRYLGKL